MNATSENRQKFETSTVRDFIKKAARFPLLKETEERDLVMRYRETKDQEARDRIVNSHLLFVVKIARSHLGYGLPYADLISEGNIGLLKAVDGFDPDKGCRFSTYASWWIKAEIRAYVIRSHSQVKIGTTQAQKKLFFNLNRLKRLYGADHDKDLSARHVGMISDTLRVSEKDVADMNNRLFRRDFSLQTPCNQDVDETASHQDFLVSDTPPPEELTARRQTRRLQRDMIADSLTKLTKREREVFINRRLAEDRMTLDDLSHKYGVSRERIRQIELKAYGKVQKHVQRLTFEMSTAQIENVGAAL